MIFHLYDVNPARLSRKSSFSDSVASARTELAFLITEASWKLFRTRSARAEPENPELSRMVSSGSLQKTSGWIWPKLVWSNLGKLSATASGTPATMTWAFSVEFGKICSRIWRWPEVSDLPNGSNEVSWRQNPQKSKDVKSLILDKNVRVWSSSQVRLWEV